MEPTEFFKRFTELKQESQYIRLKIGNGKRYVLVEDVGYDLLTCQQANDELNSWSEALSSGDQPQLQNVPGHFVRCYIPNGPPCFFCVDSVLAVEPVERR